MRVRIRRNDCIACGLCYVLSPSVYSHDEEGIATIRREYKIDEVGEIGEIPDDLKNDATRGSIACPVKAIILS